jgi:hypothetical protein
MARGKRIPAEEREAHYREYYKDRYRKNKDKFAAANRDNKLRTKYGITTEQYNEMLAAQDNSCAVCHTDTPGGRGFWHVDHCHATSKVRGILCHGCNTGLGQFKDNAATLEAAASYLRKASDESRATDCAVSCADES